MRLRHRAVRRGRVRLGLLAALVPVGVLFAVVASGTSNGSPAPLSGLEPSVPSGYKLVFDDEFPGTSLDQSLWDTCYDWGCNIATNAEYEWFVPSGVSVHDGTLTLRARRQTTHGEPYSSGMIQSNQMFDFTYGLVEVRAKMPPADGAWPAIWLAPGNLSWPPEIDIMERLGPPQFGISETLHLGADNHILRYTTRRPLSPGYHVFSLKWTPRTITWYLDGNAVFTVHKSVDELMYPIIDLATSLPPSMVPAHDYPTSLEVSWVRIYQQSGVGTSVCTAVSCIHR